MSNSTNTTKGYAPFDLYPYNPAQPPAYAFLALFGIVAICHLAAMIPFRAFFPSPLIIGCGMEAVAYYFRSRSHDNRRQTLPFILQNLLLLAAPPFLAASIYMSPRRIARVIDLENEVVSPRLITKLFVVVDVTCFGTQVAGAIMSGSEDATEAKNGETTVLAGLVIQIISFIFFTMWILVFHMRAKRNPDSSIGYMSKFSWQQPMFGLYAISILFIIRNITRIMEYKQGSDGTIQQHEVYLYVLDGCVMWAIAVIFLVLHPGRLRFKAHRLRRAGYTKNSIPLQSREQLRIGME